MLDDGKDSPNFFRYGILFFIFQDVRPRLFYLVVMRLSEDFRD